MESNYYFSDTGEGRDWISIDESSDSDIQRGDYQEIQRQCYEVYKLNSYGKRIIDMLTDYVIGAELTYSFSKDAMLDGKKVDVQAKVGDIIDRFWNDYDNDFDLNLHEMLSEMWTLGEQFYVPYIGQDKVVKLGCIDPRIVHKIEVNKNNQKRYDKVITGSNQMVDKMPTYGVINEILDKTTGQFRLGVGEDQKKETKGREYKGDVFVFQINSLPTQVRGYSEMLPMLDTLDILEQFVYQGAERSLLAMSFVADYTFTGMSPEDIKNFDVPNPNTSTYVKHNDKVKMELKTPTLGGTDLEQVFRFLTKYILAGVGIPEHWVVSGDNTNFATAKEQSAPIERRLERKQGQIKGMLKKLMRYQIEQYLPTASTKEVMVLTEGINLEFPSVAGIDRKLRASILAETQKTLMQAVRDGWITNTDGATEYVKLSNRLGIDIDLADDIEDVQPENAEDEQSDKEYYEVLNRIDKDLGKKNREKVKVEDK